MHPHQALTPRVCESDRVRYLHLVAAARATAVRPRTVQQVSHIVRATLDDEVDPTTFSAIVPSLATEVLRP